MCVILFAPPKKTIKEEKIKRAFEVNSNGAGVMWYDPSGTVHYIKGFVKVDELIKFWNSLDANYPRALHCRIATSGKVSEATCHPFPIVEDIEKMKVPSGVSDTGCLMHNGVFSRYTPKGGMKCDHSDTMEYTSKVIYPVVKFISNPGVLRLLDEMTSRILLFLPGFKIYYFGNWHKDKDEGFLASNETYEKPKYSYGYYGYYGSPYGCEYLDYNCTRYPAKGKVYTPSNILGYKMDILINAKDSVEAEDYFFSLLDDTYGKFVEDDDLYDSFKPLDDKKGLYVFTIKAKDDLEKYIEFNGKPYTVATKVRVMVPIK